MYVSKGPQDFGNDRVQIDIAIDNLIWKVYPDTMAAIVYKQCAVNHTDEHMILRQPATLLILQFEGNTTLEQLDTLRKIWHNRYQSDIWNK